MKDFVPKMLELLGMAVCYAIWSFGVLEVGVFIGGDKGKLFYNTLLMESLGPKSIVLLMFLLMLGLGLYGFIFDTASFRKPKPRKFNWLPSCEEAVRNVLLTAPGKFVLNFFTAFIGVDIAGFVTSRLHDHKWDLRWLVGGISFLFMAGVVQAVVLMRHGKGDKRGRPNFVRCVGFVIIVCCLCNAPKVYNYILQPVPTSGGTETGKDRAEMGKP